MNRQYLDPALLGHYPPEMKEIFGEVEVPILAETVETDFAFMFRSSAARWSWFMSGVLQDPATRHAAYPPRPVPVPALAKAGRLRPAGAARGCPGA